MTIRRDDTIEVIEDGRKAPREDDVIGRIMHAGATLKLHADGTYELGEVNDKGAEPRP